MKKNVLFLAGLLSLSALSFAQQRNCGTMNYFDMQKAADPSLEQRIQKIERFTQEFINEHPLQKSSGTAAVINIPVVVHVLYNTTAQNISDAQIQSQIAVLNEDFRRLNADKLNTPSSFTSVAADAEITFCLASKAPNGSATTGIIRKQTTVTSFSDNDAVKYSTQGGSDAWSASSYLNLWVCNLGGNLLGYAQFPGGAAASDGVVINYKYFGRGYATIAPFNKGRTGTHEVGHWLNLRHIWGDASCGTDYVNDTPTQQTSNYGCPAYPLKTCGNTTSGDMFMNYMDYTDDGCMNIFSTGQKTRMKALFAIGGARAGLLSSTGCGGTVNPTPAYCASKGSNVSYEWINNVKIGTINNTSGANGGYGNFTNLSTNLTIGAATAFTLAPGFSGTAYSEYFKMWIDFNKDKDFDDAGELVYTSAGSVNSVSGNMSVPSGVTAGSTRMRVIMKDGAITGPCENYTYGETEDYTVNLVSGASSSNTVLIGTGTATSGNLPYGTYYMDERSQFVITNSELIAAGYTGTNNFLKSIAFNIASLSPQVMNGFTIKIGHTSATSFTTASFASVVMTTVYSANYSPVSGWNAHTFSAPFSYNGTSNLLVEVCFNNSAYTNDSKVYFTATPDNKAIYYKADVQAGGVCGNAGGTLSNARPNVRMVFSSSSSKEGTESVLAATESAFELFPNPSSGSFNLTYNVTELSSVQISVYGLLGNMVAGYDYGVQEKGVYLTNIDLNQYLNNGIYFCTIVQNGISSTKRFVIAK